MVRAAFAVVPMIPASAEIAHAKMGHSPVSTDSPLLNIPSLHIHPDAFNYNYLQTDEELCNDD